MNQLRSALMLLAGLAVTASAQTTVTIEKVVRSVGTGRDSVPGREGTSSVSFVFWGEKDTEPPVINNTGEVVFRANSASALDSSTEPASGIYVNRPPGEPLAVLMDTTKDDDGNPTFAVPGQPSDTVFLAELLGAPLINDKGDVVFFAQFDGPTSGRGEGFYATTTTGGAIVKIVDTTDPVPGHSSAAVFDTFRCKDPLLCQSDTLARMAISINDIGQAVYWAQFCLELSCTSGTKNGIFGTTVSIITGEPPILLADSTRKICPTGNPLGVTCEPSLDQGFWEIRREKGLTNPGDVTNTGDVIFHGSIRQGGSSCCGGVFSIPVTGGDITTSAYRIQPAPPDGTAIYSDRFDEVAHNEAGSSLFLPRLGFTAPARFGIYAGDLTGGPQVRVADTVPGTGPDVPAPAPAAPGEFTSLEFPAMNDAGQMGFRALSTNSVDANTDGIYAADTSGGPIRLVMDTLFSPVPGRDLPATARMISFRKSLGVSINADGNMAFAGRGLLDPLSGGLFQGIYFYDACGQEVIWIADSTTSLADLGGSFGTSGEFEVYTQGEARAGQYRSINDSNQVAFTAQFSDTDFGIYVASVSNVGGGSVTIECPPDVTAECPADTSPDATGEPTTGGCGTIAVTFADSITPGYGGTETIARTWTADGAGGTASCVQTIEVIDTIAPAVSCTVATGELWSPDHELINVGLVVSVTDECDGAGAAESVTVEVWSDETEIPDTGDGTGRFAPDAKELELGLRLRNERRGKGDGRVYLVVVRSEDGSGNVAFGTCTAVVPNNQSQAGLDLVVEEAESAEATVAATAGTTINEKVAPLVEQGWTQHGISPEIGPKQ